MQPHLPLYFFTYFSGLGLSLSFWMSGSYWRRQLLGADARKVTWPPRSTFNCFSLITLELQKLQHLTLCGSLSSKNQNSVFCIFRNASSARGGTSYGAGGPPPSDFDAMGQECRKTRPLPPLSDGITVYGAAEIQWQWHNGWSKSES